MGLGGFFDGIVLHQILQWHHLISARHPPDSLGALQDNTLLDGLFHAATYLFTAVGIWLVWKNAPAQRDTATFVGTLLVGWGLFNVIEGLINHQILGLHHVRPGPGQLAYDLGFLVWGAFMLAAGLRLIRSRQMS
ncbi:membrane protein [Deinococcus malanensis]|uniref:Membrane protein n=1 Tax=Deinococcus malanensis TaxID=1706855 RepID=A0ABQ2ENP0_9DEIO|nr:membrane protein [Deinococcus malanensis]